jgi:hypothetical protein
MQTLHRAIAECRPTQTEIMPKRFRNKLALCMACITLVTVLRTVVVAPNLSTDEYVWQMREELFYACCATLPTSILSCAFFFATPKLAPASSETLVGDTVLVNHLALAVKVGQKTCSPTSYAVSTSNWNNGTLGQLYAKILVECGCHCGRFLDRFC